MSENRILLGFDRMGESTHLPLHHTVFVGITGIGKTEAIKALASRASEKTKFLILDVKSKRDYADFGTEIPIFMLKQTDPLMVKRLLETQGKMKLKFEFPELIKVTKAAKEKTWEGILETINKFLEEKKHPVEEAKLLVLQHLLTRLLDEMRTVEVSDRLELPAKINVMNLSRISEELQQIPVHSVVSYALAHKEELWSEDLVIVIDEAHRFIPQGESRGSKDTIVKAVKEGRSARLWMWFSDQSITETEKGALKQCWNWLLSKQTELNETKRTLDQIPFKKELGITADEVQTLPIGFFVVCTDKFRKIVYALVNGVPEDVGRKVVLGEISPEYISEHYLKRKEAEDELVWKEKYLELEAKYAKMESDVETLRKSFAEELQRRVEEERQKALHEANQRLDEIKSQWNTEEYQTTIVTLKDENTKLNERVAALEKQTQILQKLRELLTEMGLSTPTLNRAGLEPSAPSEIVVTTEQPAISIKIERKQLALSDKDLLGKIVLVYAQGGLGTDWFTVSDVTHIFERHAWSRDPRASSTLDSLVQWGFLEKRYSGKRPEYKVRLPAEEAKKRDLLKVEE